MVETFQIDSTTGEGQFVYAFDPTLKPQDFDIWAPNSGADNVGYWEFRGLNNMPISGSFPIVCRETAEAVPTSF